MDPAAKDLDGLGIQFSLLYNRPWCSDPEIRESRVEREMSGMSRRELLRMAAQDAAAAGLLAAGAREMGAVPVGIPIGSQTYPHRKRIQDGDFAGLCRDMREIGVGNLELCSTAYAEFAV